MDIINISVDKLIPYERNPRKNNEAVKYVAESIKEFGFKVPIIVDKNFVIVAGHTRCKAALQLGIKEVPCIMADDLTDEQIKAFRLADNKVAEFAEWDKDLLQLELGELDLDMEVFGFNTEKELKEGETPSLEEIKEPITKTGDVWQLGAHRLLCGDCTDESTIDKLFEGNVMDLCVTDPPYNVNYEGTAGKIANDNMSDSSFNEFLFKFYTQMLRALKPGGAFYIWHADSEGYNFRGALKQAGGTVRQCLIWKKNSLVLGRQDYQWIHEPCLYGWKDGAKHYFVDDRSQTTVYEDQANLAKMSKTEMRKMLTEILSGKVSTTVIEEDKPSKNGEHPTMKPVKLIGRLIKNSSAPGEKVVDFFGGSGSTLIACEQLGRKCYTMELDPKYCDVIIKRWENLTGQKAVRL